MDKEPTPGYSRELVSVDLAEKDYEDFNNDVFNVKQKTYLDFFELNCEEDPDRPFLGERKPDSDGKFGPYEWTTFAQTRTICQALARGMYARELANEQEGDGRTWSFTGIWSKNRMEWLQTHIANMYNNYTTIGFFDSMGVESVDFIVK